jgi:hypothetical protein
VGGSVKNYIFHFIAPQGAASLLSQTPPDGINNIGFTAAVWPNNRSHAIVKIYNRFVGKRFET